MGLLSQELSPQDMALFCTQLAAGYGGGLTLVNTLDLMAKGKDKRSVCRVASRMAHCLRRGATLGQAAHWERRYLPNIAVAMLELGDRSGQLQPILEALAFYYKERADIHRAVVQQLTYPILLILCMFIVIPMVQRVVLASFSGASDSDIALMAVGMLIERLLPIAALLFVLWAMGRFLPIKRWLRELMYRLRLFSALTRSFAVARYCGSLGILLKTDLPLHQAIVLAAQTADNTALEKDFASPAPRVKTGSTVAEAFYDVRSLPIQAHLYIATGEESGMLEDAFNEIAKNVYNESMHKLRKFVVVLEAALVILIAFGYFGGFTLMVRLIFNMIGG